MCVCVCVCVYVCVRKKGKKQRLRLMDFAFFSSVCMFDDIPEMKSDMRFRILTMVVYILIKQYQLRKVEMC